MAGIHGNEPASVEAVLDLLATGGQGEVAGGGPVWVVPALNPDGLLINHKDSARGIDLNRNFPARNCARTTRPATTPARAPLSEPEAACFAALVERIRPRAVVAVHAPFACINHDGPAAGLGGGGGRRLRLAGAGGHRIPHPRVAGQLAGGGPGPARADDRAAPGAPMPGFATRPGGRWPRPCAAPM